MGIRVTGAAGTAKPHTEVQATIWRGCRCGHAVGGHAGYHDALPPDQAHQVGPCREADCGCQAYTGRIVPLGTIAYYDKNPLKRWGMALRIWARRLRIAIEERTHGRQIPAR